MHCSDAVYNIDSVGAGHCVGTLFIVIEIDCFACFSNYEHCQRVVELVPFAPTNIMNTPPPTRHISLFCTLAGSCVSKPKQLPRQCDTPTGACTTSAFLSPLDLRPVRFLKLIESSWVRHFVWRKECHWSKRSRTGPLRGWGSNLVVLSRSSGLDTNICIGYCHSLLVSNIVRGFSDKSKVQCACTWARTQKEPRKLIDITWYGGYIIWNS